MRAQVFITDLLFTAAIFAMLFFLIALEINQSIASVSVEFDKVKGQLLADQLASLLVSSPGSPVGWNETNIIYPGIVDFENHLVMSKFTRLAGIHLGSKLNMGQYNISVIIDEVRPTGDVALNCTDYLRDKYGNCTFMDEPRTSRLLTDGSKVYKLWVVVS